MTKSPARISNEGEVAHFKVLNPLSPDEAEIIFSEKKTLIVRNSHMGGQNQRSQNAYSVRYLIRNTTQDGQISQT